MSANTKIWTHHKRAVESDSRKSTSDSRTKNISLVRVIFDYKIPNITLFKKYKHEFSHWRPGFNCCRDQYESLVTSQSIRPKLLPSPSSRMGHYKTLNRVFKTSWMICQDKICISVTLGNISATETRGQNRTVTRKLQVPVNQQIKPRQLLLISIPW